MDNIKTKEEYNDLTSKKICFDHDISKKMLKKPTLNPEIIYEIFETLSYNCFKKFLGLKDKEQKKKKIEIFMASGRQPLNAALRFFTRVNKVYVNKYVWCDNIEMFIDDDKIGEISYNSLFLKPILNVIGPSINDFSLSHLPEGANIDDIFEVLVNEGIENVSISKSLTAKCFSKLCQITSIQHLSYPFTIAQLPLIRSKSSKFRFGFDFAELIKEKPENFSMPWVKDLRICSDVELSDFTAESVEYFVKCISEIFPNVEELYIEFEPSNQKWKTAYGIMKVLEPHLFESIPLSVKGKIEMDFLSDKHASLDEFQKLTEGDDEYVIGNWMAYKDFEIHDRFTAALFIMWDDD